MEEDPLAGHPVLRTIRTLGTSGVHIVVLARNSVTGHLVAIKLIPRGFDSSQAKYLLRELLNHYELTLAKHPHIVSLLDCFLTPRHLAIVMEYVDGENLQVFMEKAGGCVIEPLARFLFQQLVIAVDFCHRRGKVNRNIRPSSLLLQLSESALPLLRMVDFSASKDTLRNSEPKSQVGTAMYCAPEVLQNFSGVPYDAAAADMWSLGVVMFMMLFGRHPFSRAEDMALSAHQQVIAMFKRVTAPQGSYDGDLFVPHSLPTSALPSAQPGAPLTLAASDLLRGLLSRDPKTRMTVEAVQCHEWFRTGLPEGAALLNEVVAAEEEEAGAAAVMPPSVAAQLERMVVLAAAGPALRGAAVVPVKDGGRSRSGGPGDGGGGGSGGGAGGGGGGGGGGGVVRDSSGGGAGPMAYAPMTPQSSQQQPQQPQHQPQQQQGPVVVRTVTTTGSSDAVHQSVAIGVMVTEVTAGRHSGGGSCSMPLVTTEEAVPALVSPTWTGAAADGIASDLLADLEAMVMGLPEDDILSAASLDFLLNATVQQQLQQQPQPRQQQQPQQQPQQQSYGSSVAANHSAPVSTDRTVDGCAAVPSPPQPPQQQQQPPQQQQQQQQQYPAPHLTLNQVRVHHTAPGADGPPSRPSDAGAMAVPHTLDELLHKAPRDAAGAAPDTAPHRPAGTAPLPALQLFMSLHAAAAAAGAVSEVHGAMLPRLSSDSLPSPNTLAVVDAQPFLALGPPEWVGGGAGGGTYYSRRDTSMATVPSTYSMDWCTLSSRSETLLSPKFINGAAGSAGDGGGALVSSSVWHRICSDARGALSGVAADARDLGRAAVAGLARR